MTDLTSPCPTCGTELPRGAERCPGCGRVFGEDNRCPHCHAIAAVRASGDGYVCVACSKPRERKPLTTVLGDGPKAAIVPDAARSLRGRGLRSLGVLSLAVAVLGAALSTAILGLGAAGLTMAAASALVGGLFGVSMLRRAGRADDKAQSFADSTAEARVREVARKLGGDVTAKAVGEALGVPTEDADRVLTRITDGTEITVEVDTDDGTLHYVFQEIVAARKQVRISAEIGRETDPDVDRAEAEAEELEALQERKTRI